MVRLGLWGAGTSFSEFRDFLGGIFAYRNYIFFHSCLWFNTLFLISPGKFSFVFIFSTVISYEMKNNGDNYVHITA